MIWMQQIAAIPVMPFLAQLSGSRNERFQAMQSRFKQPDPTIYIGILTAATAIVAIFVVVKLLARWQEKRAEGIQPQPWKLYGRIQSQLGLPLLDRVCLWRLARVLRIEHPTALLISPQFYDHAVEQFVKGRHGSRQVRFLQIREKLFASAAPPIV